MEHYEQCLEKFGDTHLGVDWPKKEDALLRYRIMLDLYRFDRYADTKVKFTLLDFGCGAAHLLEYIIQNDLHTWDYVGFDLSEKFIELCRQKFPSHKFIWGDVLLNELILPNADYVVMNGVFTEKRSLSFPEMYQFMQAVLLKVFPLCQRGLAFNVMSKSVDWERDDLFHLPIDMLADFLTRNLSRHFIIRNDYGLYEYTVYLYH